MLYCGGKLLERIKLQMTVKGFFKKWLVDACVYFTVFMLIYIILAAIVNVGDGALRLDAGRTVLFFVFAFLLAAANTIFRLDRISTALRVIIHYVLTLFGFYSCFLMTLNMRVAQVFIGLVLFTVLYFIIFGIVAAFRAKYRSNTERSEKYEKRYKAQTKNR